MFSVPESHDTRSDLISHGPSRHILRLTIVATALFQCMFFTTSSAQNPGWDFLGIPPNAGAIHRLIQTPDPWSVIAGADSGVFRFENSSRTWKRLLTTTHPVWSLLLLPPDTIFAGTLGGGLYRSVDGGIAWNSVSAFPHQDCGALALDDSGNIVAGSNDVYVSRDFGDTWEALNTCPNQGCRVHGLNFSPYLFGADPERGDVVSQEAVHRLLTRIQPYTSWVRTFGCTNGLEHVGRIAHGMGMHAAIGAWLDTNSVANNTQIDSLVAIAARGEADIAIVGNERLRFARLTEAELIQWIDTTRARLRRAHAPDIPVTTADTYDQLLNAPSLLDTVDVIMANCYPYWEKRHIDEAIVTLHNASAALRNRSNGKTIIISETGWPTCGETEGAAVPSLENAIRYHREVVTWSRVNSVPVFHFEAFDERWKVAKEGQRGACWGLFDEHEQLKPGMDTLFACAETNNTWSPDTIPCGGPGIPMVHLTFIPPWKANPAELIGRVWHVNPQDYRIVVYLYAWHSQWWSKPWADSLILEIDPADCSFRCPITTGGVDHFATRYAVFLIHKSFTPDTCLPCVNSIPRRMYDSSAAYVEYDRDPCGYFRSLLVRSDLILAGSEAAGIFRTTDRGQHWSRQDDPKTEPSAVLDIIDRDDMGTFKTAQWEGITRGDWDGAVWHGALPSQFKTGWMDSDVTPDGWSMQLAAATDHGVLIATDQNTPEFNDAGLQVSQTTAVAFSPLVTDSTILLYVGTADTGVYRTMRMINDAESPVAFPTSMEIGRPYPMPVKSVVTIPVRIVRPGTVRIEITDALGRTVGTVFDGYMSSSSSTLQWDARGRRPGLYFLRMISRNNTAVARILVVPW